MRLIEKIARLKRTKDGKDYSDEVEYFVSLAPNHYQLNVSQDVYDKVTVGEEYEITLGLLKKAGDA